MTRQRTSEDKLRHSSQQWLASQATPASVYRSGFSMAAFVALAACAPPDLTEAHGTNVEEGCLALLVDRSGHQRTGTELLSDLSDPFIENVIAADGECPTDMAGIVENLNLTDSEDCVSPGGGMLTRVVSERGQIGAPDPRYRTVSSRVCGGREAHELMFSLLGFGSDEHPVEGSSLPSGVEVMAFDKSSGVFNYYKELDGEIHYFGSSKDFVLSGPGLNNDRQCANCHRGGGPIMKELESPWVHWEGRRGVTVGVDELFTGRESVLGQRSNGAELEQTVKAGTEAWNRKRLEILLAERDVKELLRPLFCPVEVNVGSQDGSGFAQSASAPGLFLLDPVFESEAPRLSFEASHSALVEAVGQRVPGTQATTLQMLFVFLHRSFADFDYVQRLVDPEVGVIDEQFRDDVLMIDFTRPTFSDDRCDLLAFAPSLGAGDAINADTLRDGFIRNIDKLGADPATPAGQLRLLFELSKQNSSLDHSAIRSAFAENCQERLLSETIEVGQGAQRSSVSALAADLFKLKSLQRQIAFPDDPNDLDPAIHSGSASHPFSVFEFQETMPRDDIEVTPSAEAGDLLKVHPDARLNRSCQLVSHFEPLFQP